MSIAFVKIDQVVRGILEVVLLAVKPQMMDQVLPALEALQSQKPLYLSVAAGRTIAGFEAAFGADAAIIRAMPNTPALVGEGAAGLAVGQTADEKDLEWGVGILDSGLLKPGSP